MALIAMIIFAMFYDNGYNEDGQLYLEYFSGCFLIVILSGSITIVNSSLTLYGVWPPKTNRIYP
ncbi:hypothetical protein LSH36_257g02036 [Paralvinella palmiformis]|uniref:Uncharacterized protein n=1 Tax=Paralvinella palmiformis TaxID=53620 RepID=A0AAD9JKJ4_9ANNE|nr:hypothetical protein LSH36_257g02036 [Paralvinella palmiformis]